MGRTPNLVTWTLVVLAAATLTVTVVEALSGSRLGMLLFLPSAVALAALAAWLVASMAGRDSAGGLRDCRVCGAQWRPADEGGSLACPACSALSA